MLDRQHLMILREVDRLGSLTAAADRLNVTQSALSHAIRRFEERYGVAVWLREGRTLRLTQAGEYLLALAQRVLPQLDHAEAVLADYASGQRGALRVGMECHPCQQWLMRVVSPYLAAWPDVDLEIRTAFRFGGLGALLGHEIDLIITPDPMERPEIAYAPVFDYELVLAVPVDHPIGAVAVPSDLAGEMLITYPVPPERLDVFTRFLAPAHVSPARHRTVETTDMMLQLVAAGRGVSAVPDWLLREEGRGLPIRAARIGAQGLPKSIHLGMRVGEEATDYIAGFVNIARATSLSAPAGSEGLSPDST
ncbi:LysR family transcriptional regulator [Haematobacter missouriensis]|mgnify:CR=1 FL=1|uniref:HTH-type transcriptional regulator MetR n=1 Tax=Haematobacter missouriensis TaxID=366616 RepID=A0A212AQA1_9RHOB|nr:LysR family transcriptional regulator [Haematobacter missouriensis]KFI30205.1 LysR family transcriptional regulator [Haematobacter missouriensis]OWJ74529.1 LysR family transcriptional regulator [Haematobacter missouriensis]OWJ83635.1 LysR family transcriptional regulator [Haematobacter missouriensis]